MTKLTSDWLRYADFTAAARQFGDDIKQLNMSMSVNGFTNYSEVTEWAGWHAMDYHYSRLIGDDVDMVFLVPDTRGKHMVWTADRPTAFISDISSAVLNLFALTTNMSGNHFVVRPGKPKECVLYRIPPYGKRVTVPGQ